MIITISSAQGQGKTTLLNELQKEGYIIQRNTTARSILKEWNETLNNVYSDPKKTQKFQEVILQTQAKFDMQMIDNVEYSANVYGINSIITERSYADIFTYTLMTLGAINDYDDFVKEYYESCKRQQKNYSHVIFLTGRDYVPEDDGVRSTNPEFGAAVDYLVEKYVKEFGDESTVHIVNESELEDRVKRVKEIIKKVTSYE